MVDPVMPSPPQRSLLGRAGPQERQHELERSAGAEGAVGEVAVIAPRDGEHPHEEGHAEQDQVGIGLVLNTLRIFPRDSQCT